MKSLKKTKIQFKTQGIRVNKVSSSFKGRSELKERDVKIITMSLLQELKILFDLGWILQSKWLTGNVENSKIHVFIFDERIELMLLFVKLETYISENNVFKVKDETTYQRKRWKECFKSLRTSLQEMCMVHVYPLPKWPNQDD